MNKRWLWFLLATMLVVANSLRGESRIGTVSGDNAHVNVYFSKAQDYSYTLSAQPSGGWKFTSAFSFSGSNGWYKSGAYSASCEQLPGVTTAFIDAATAFSATISGSMYKDGPGPGSPIAWSVTGGDGSGEPIYYYITPLTAVLPVGGGETETFHYYFCYGVPALSGCWKIASTTTGGGDWQFFQGNSLTFPWSGGNYAPGEYIITAARNTNDARAKSTGPVRLVGVQKVSTIYGETSITSTTDTPGVTETVYIPVGESVTITAAPIPSGAWPEGYPKWSVAGVEQTAIAGSGSFTFSTTTPGEYIISARCGTGTYSTKAVKIVVYRLTSRTEAVSPIDRSRSILGVYEITTIGLEPSSAFAGVSWAASRGELIDQGVYGEYIMKDLIVPDQACTITVTIAATPTIEKNFSVIEPNGVFMELYSDSSIRHIQGTVSIGFDAAAYILPDTVSFSKIKVREGACPSITTGCWNSFTEPHPAWQNYKAMKTTVVPGKGTLSEVHDEIDASRTGNWGSGGTLLWQIPWVYQLEDGTDKQFVIVSHYVEVDSTGKATLSKGGISLSREYNDPTCGY